MFSTAVFFVVLNNVDSRAHTVLICLCSAAAISTLAMSGYYVNILDIAPQYAGFLAGFTNVIGTILTLVAPYAAGAIASAPSGSHVWRQNKTAANFLFIVVDFTASVEKRVLSYC